MRIYKLNKWVNLIDKLPICIIQPDSQFLNIAGIGKTRPPFRWHNKFLYLIFWVRTDGYCSN